MTVTQDELGRRIRTAREASHMTQDDAAKHLGVSRPTFVQIEAGKRSVSSLELDRLAYLFGRDIREFVATDFHQEDALTALFRAQGAVVGEPEVLDKLRECMALGRELTNLERLVGIDRELSAVVSHRFSAFPAPKGRWEAVQQGQRLAEEERRRLGLGAAPLPNMSELLESQGVRAALVELPNDVSGLTLSDRKVGLFVVANSAHHHLRRRFSLAHEYAHVVADRDRAGLISQTSARDDLIEIRANAFAANFLMSAEGVRQFVAGLGKGRPSRVFAEVFDEDAALGVEGRTEPGSQTIQLYDVVQLAHHFGVSRLSALFRLRNLRLVSDAEFAHLKALDDAGKGKQLATRLGLAAPDHEELRSEFKHRFLGLALEAYRRDEISRGKLRELVAMVKLTVDDLDQLLAEAGIDGEVDLPP
jgi:Zn-dependent peptidase ImmA (M78 family)/transcriptional regulator with XRE-family HTH domain